jgi:hypothetical protein
LYYHGIRIHIIGRRQPGSLPIPEYIGVTGASDHDGKIFDQIRPQWLSTAVSRVRQPIEALFAWIEEKNRH